MPPQLDQNPLVLLTAFVLAVIAVGRFTRLVVDDMWPPMVWLRNRYIAATIPGDDPNEPGWHKLATCPFCFAPWPALVDLVWAYASGLDPSSWWGAAWWAANVWFAGAYLAAILLVRDEPPAE